MEATNFNKYQQGKIYKIISDLTDTIYVGSTTSTLSARMAQHRRGYKHFINTGKGFITSYEILEIDPDCQIILIENYPCNSKDELRAHERYHIELNREICVNISIPCRSKKEYNEANKEKIAQRDKEYRKEYRKANKEKIAQNKIEYYEANKEKMDQYKKEWYEINKDRIRQKKKEYYEENKEKILQKESEQVMCECGRTSTKQHLTRHRKTVAHQKLMMNIQIHN